MRPYKYPVVGEIVMVSPTKITDLGVYVDILDYNLEGLIMLRDLSKNRIRSISKIVQIGKKFPASVTNVDTDTENIMLSKKCVSETENELCEKNFKESKYIADIAELFKRKMEANYNKIINPREFYENFIWCISHDPTINVRALRTAAKDFEKVYSGCQMDETWKCCFREVLANKFKESAIIVEAVLEINCDQDDGVNIIREGLLLGQNSANESCPFRIKVIKAPYYSITVKTLTPYNAVETINNAITIIKNFFSEKNTQIRIIKQADIIIEEEFKPADSDSDHDDD